MDAYISLSFGTTFDRVRTLRINNPLLTISDNQVRGAMTDIINSNIVSGASGRINAMRRATLVETEIIPIALVF